MMGVDYELFWKLNPKTLQPFIKAFELEEERKDVWAWQQGLYIQVAVASNFNKEVKYPSTPFLKLHKIMNDEEERQRRIKENFLIHMTRINSQFKSGEVEN